MDIFGSCFKNKLKMYFKFNLVTNIACNFKLNEILHIILVAITEIKSGNHKKNAFLVTFCMLHVMHFVNVN